MVHKGVAVRLYKAALVSGLADYLKPLGELPGGMKPGTVPPEITAQIEKLCHGVFDAMEQSGNSKQTVLLVIESLLANQQLIIFEYLKLFKLKDANSMNIDLVLLTALTRVALTNPMWDSEALTLQLKTECHQILRGAGGVMLDED